MLFFSAMPPFSDNSSSLRYSYYENHSKKFECFSPFDRTIIDRSIPIIRGEFFER